MIKDIFASLISITKGLHRDNRTERDYKELNRKLKNDIKYKLDLFYKIELSEKVFGEKRKFYKTLIDVEAANKFNNLIESFPKNAIEEEYIFNYQQLYGQYRQYLIGVKSYIDKHNHTKDSLNQEDTFVIQYLKANVIWLLMELQERFSKYSNEDEMTVAEVNNYYFGNISDFYDVIKTSTSDVKDYPASIAKKRTTVEREPMKKVSFGYKHRDTEKLKSALKSLVLKVDLIDENSTSIEDLYNLMIASNFTEIQTKIHLSCETTQFRYIIDVFKAHFSNFTPTSIENTKLFYTKNNVLLKKSNLYKNKVLEPKSKTDIDNIIKQLQ